MKKLKFLLLICLLTIVATGCVKFNANMNIKSDKSMDFTIIYALDKTVFGDEASVKESDFEDAKKEGFIVSKYSEGNMEGVTLTRKINNIDEVSTESDTEYDLSGMMSNKEGKYLFKVVKGSNKNTYYAKFKFDSNESGLSMPQDGDDTQDETLPDEVDDKLEDGSSDDVLSGMDLNKLTANMDLSFNVTLPNAAISNNATKTEDNNKKLSWTLSSTNAQTIEFAFELSNNGGMNNMILYVGIGVIALLVIIVIVLMLSKNKGQKNPSLPVENNNTTTSQPVASASNVETSEPAPEINKEESSN